MKVLQVLSGLCVGFLLFDITYASDLSRGYSEVLVYSGPGACEEGCSRAAYNLASRLGYKVRYVSPKTLHVKMLEHAKIWIQPGGDAITVARNLSKEQKQAIRQFIANGGFYLGFCAGAFFADHYVDDQNTIEGLSLLPGTTFDLIKDTKPHILPINWNGKTRHMFFQEGPGFQVDVKAPVEVIATYPDRSPSVLRFHFGKGKVVLSGVHPEAPDEWTQEAGLVDPDGSDLSFAADLME